ncbi:MAG: 3-dehydroquinate synthase [Salinivirgaceae bacterium]|nr:MAG: 3-dehydroquinate synthase [Salinivirgaceae bacterium]
MIITQNPNAILDTIIEKQTYSSLYLLSDSNTYTKCMPVIADSVKKYNIQTLTITAGENTKNIDTCIHLWEQLNEKMADRHSLLINLGGGMITDIGGFIASTFKRGMSFINIPTSMLAMIDASIGGKNGINFGSYKNQIGVINEPMEVIVSPIFLKTLDRRNYLSGYAEALKHGLIGGKDAYKVTIPFISPSYERDDFTSFLQKNISIKEKIVAIDPTEKADRKALNIGHTIGHALESLSHNKNEVMLHGEAVAWGMIAELKLAELVFGKKPEILPEIESFIAEHYQQPPMNENDFNELLSIMKQDKKNYKSEINFTLLKEAGQYKINQTATENQIIESLKYICKLCKS